jgi:hypothetical protein
VFAVLALQPVARGNEFVLTDGNSTVNISTTSDYGMYGWNVDGVNTIYKQWFYYRPDGQGMEKPLNDLSLISAVQPTDSTLVTMYGNAQFSIQVNYTLLGGAAGSGGSDVGEQIKIKNLTGSPLTFHFFQYTDFDLDGSYNGDTVQLGKNVQGQFNEALQSKPDGASNIHFADTVISPGANHGEVGTGQTIFNKLIDNSPTTLDDFAGPVTGDATWAFEWDPVIPAGGSFTIGLTKNQYMTLVPEPSTLSLIPMGLTMFALVRRNRRSSK